MPIYDYRCCECETTFEALVRSGDAVTCPHCGSTTLKTLLSAPAVLKGLTARPAGHTCCGREERCAAPPCAEDGGCCRG